MGAGTAGRHCSGDRHAERRAAALDPYSESGKIRAFFVAPEHARNGIGTAILKRCEEDARSYGFSRLALLAALPGVRRYSQYGYVANAPELESEFVPMRKTLSSSGCF